LKHKEVVITKIPTKAPHERGRESEDTGIKTKILYFPSTRRMHMDMRVTKGFEYNSRCTTILLPFITPLE
jgi:hypothetical protein